MISSFLLNWCNIAHFPCVVARFLTCLGRNRQCRKSSSTESHHWKVVVRRGFRDIEFPGRYTDKGFRRLLVCILPNYPSAISTRPSRDLPQGEVVRKEDMKMPTIIPAVTTIWVVLFATSVHASQERDIVIGDTGFVIAVPTEWQRGPVSGDHMKLHLRNLHLVSGFDDFDVFVMNHGVWSRKSWLKFYTKENLPQIFGRFTISYEDEVTAGGMKGRLFHVVDLEKKRNCGLLEALLFSKDQVFFLRYIYTLPNQSARTTMNRILASLTDSPAAVHRANLWYEEGVSLGREKVGLFLSLPLGWVPDTSRKNDDVVIVKIPTGGMLKVTALSRVFSGLSGLKKALAKQLGEKELPAETEAVPFGIDGSEAFRFRMDPKASESFVEGLYGLHGKGGFALILTSKEEADRLLFEKVCAKVLLMDPSKSNALRRKSLSNFKKALRKNDIDGVRESLSDLVWYVGNQSVARAISLGLKAEEPIQLECVVALGRSVVPEAGKALGKVLNSGPMSLKAKVAFDRAFSMTSGNR